MAKNDQAASLLRDLKALEDFFFELLGNLTTQKLRHGEDVMPYAEKAGIKIPDVLRGAELTWDSRSEFEAEHGDADAIVLVRPGRMQSLGFTIGCIRWGRFKVCLECGWLWCRIVIKGSF